MSITDLLQPIKDRLDDSVAANEEELRDITDQARLIAALEAVLVVHKQDPAPSLIGPYCTHCTSPIDGGPELYPCATVKALVSALESAA